MASRSFKRIVWIALIGALLVAGSFRAWGWLEPRRVFGSVEGMKIYVQR